MLDDEAGDVRVGHVEAEVGLVVAVLAHRLFERHLREAPARVVLLQVDAEHFLPHLEDEPLHHAEDVVLRDERHLDVDLGELRLAIEPQVLVAEAFDDLKVLVEPGDHVELLEQLRALGEREELPRVHAAGDEEVAGAAGRVLHHHRRLELEEARLVEVAARRLVNAVTDAQRALERGATQIEVAVLEALLLVRVDAVGNLEGGRVALVEDRHLDDLHFDFARRQARVLVRPARDDDAADADDPLAPERLRLVVRLLRQIAEPLAVGIEHELGDPLAVAEVDEDAPAVIPVARDPPKEDDLFAFVGCAERAAVVGTFQLVDEPGHWEPLLCGN